MVAHHVGRFLTEAQRKRWMTLLLETADEVGLPSDPEFRSAFVGYLEWGSRIAVVNSNSNTNPVSEQEPMPQWGWGETRGPVYPLVFKFDEILLVGIDQDDSTRSKNSL